MPQAPVAGPVRANHGLIGFAKPPLGMPKPRARPNRGARYKPKQWNDYFDSMDYAPDVPTHPA